MHSAHTAISEVENSAQAHDAIFTVEKVSDEGKKLSVVDT